MGDLCPEGVLALGLEAEQSDFSLRRSLNCRSLAFLVQTFRL